MPPSLKFYPPLLPTACPWTTHPKDLLTLYESPGTGAITLRTSMLNGFAHDADRMKFLFYNCQNCLATNANPPAFQQNVDYTIETGSLNNLGYSPFPLSFYLDFVRQLKDPKKPIIVSVTGTPTEIAECYTHISALQTEIPSASLAMEINLSCPNITNAPPPAYNADALSIYLDVLSLNPSIAVGIKTPPYTYADQFTMLKNVLLSSGAEHKLSFITSTNTLGNCLVLTSELEPALPGSGVGGMAGTPLHALSLGNVRAIQEMLNSEEKLKNIDIIGVGGVSDIQGFQRMLQVGAKFVGIATTMGRKGVSVFEEITSKLEKN